MPALMHLAQARTFFRLPSMSVRTDCKLGRNLRRDIPVMRCPTPPLDLAMPRRLITLPATGFFPHM